MSPVGGLVAKTVREGAANPLKRSRSDSDLISSIASRSIKNGLGAPSVPKKIKAVVESADVIPGEASSFIQALSEIESDVFIPGLLELLEQAENLSQVEFVEIIRNCPEYHDVKVPVSDLLNFVNRINEIEELVQVDSTNITEDNNLTLELSSEVMTFTTRGSSSNMIVNVDTHSILLRSLFRDSKVIQGDSMSLEQIDFLLSNLFDLELLGQVCYDDDYGYVYPNLPLYYNFASPETMAFLIDVIMKDFSLDELLKECKEVEENYPLERRKVFFEALINELLESQKKPEKFFGLRRECFINYFFDNENVLTLIEMDGILYGATGRFNGQGVLKDHKSNKLRGDIVNGKLFQEQGCLNNPFPSGESL